MESIRESQMVSKLESAAAIAGIAAVSLFMNSAPAAADTVTVNFGACQSELAQTQSDQTTRDQAPGQTGLGPLTIVGDKVIVPAGFEGAQGCSR